MNPIQMIKGHYEAWKLLAPMKICCGIVKHVPDRRQFRMKIVILINP